MITKVRLSVRPSVRSSVCNTLLTPLMGFDFHETFRVDANWKKCHPPPGFENFGSRSRSQGSENRLFWVIFAHLFVLLLQLCEDLAIIAHECAEGLYEKT